MSVVGTFLDIVRKAEILLEDGFELVEDVDKKGVGSKHFSKHFTVSILYDHLLFMVKTKVDINGVVLENKIQFTYNTYPSVEDKIKDTIKVISDLSNGYF